MKLVVIYVIVFFLIGCCNQTVSSLDMQLCNSDRFNAFMMIVYLPTTVIVAFIFGHIASRNYAPSEERDSNILLAIFISESIWGFVYWGVGLGEYFVRAFFY